jgi:L-xylulokinase
MLRAVYEGIVFSHKTHIERLLNFRESPEVIRCTGGASQSDVWMQMFADVVGIPMEIPSGTQLGALGAAMAAAVSIGVYDDFIDAVEHMTGIARRFDPDLRLHRVYKTNYHTYKELIRHLSN